jgi:hypothetical protein
MTANPHQPVSKKKHEGKVDPSRQAQEIFLFLR